MIHPAFRNRHHPYYHCGSQSPTTIEATNAGESSSNNPPLRSAFPAIRECGSTDSSQSTVTESSNTSDSNSDSSVNSDGNSDGNSDCHGDDSVAPKSLAALVEVASNLFDRQQEQQDTNKEQGQNDIAAEQAEKEQERQQEHYRSGEPQEQQQQQQQQKEKERQRVPEEPCQPSSPEPKTVVEAPTVGIVRNRSESLSSMSSSSSSSYRAATNNSPQRRKRELVETRTLTTTTTTTSSSSPPSPLSTKQTSYKPTSSTMAPATATATAHTPPQTIRPSLRVSAGVVSTAHCSTREGFVERLRWVLDDERCAYLEWTPGVGPDAFVVRSSKLFSTSGTMHHLFGIRKMSSFWRRLHQLGFSRIRDPSDPHNLDVFSRPGFGREQKERREHRRAALVKEEEDSGSVSLSSPVSSSSSSSSSLLSNTPPARVVSNASLSAAAFASDKQSPSPSSPSPEMGARRMIALPGSLPLPPCHASSSSSGISKKGATNIHGNHHPSIDSNSKSNDETTTVVRLRARSDPLPPNPTSRSRSETPTHQGLLAGSSISRGSPPPIVVTRKRDREPCPPPSPETLRWLGVPPLGNHRSSSNNNNGNGNGPSAEEGLFGHGWGSWSGPGPRHSNNSPGGNHHHHHHASVTQQQVVARQIKKPRRESGTAASSIDRPPPLEFVAEYVRKLVESNHYDVAAREESQDKREECEAASAPSTASETIATATATTPSSSPPPKDSASATTKPRSESPNRSAPHSSFVPQQRAHHRPFVAAPRHPPSMMHPCGPPPMPYCPPHHGMPHCPPHNGMHPLHHPYHHHGHPWDAHGHGGCSFRSFVYRSSESATPAGAGFYSYHHQQHHTRAFRNGGNNSARNEDDSDRNHIDNDNDSRPSHPRVIHRIHSPPLSDRHSVNEAGSVSAVAVEDSSLSGDDDTNDDSTRSSRSSRSSNEDPHHSKIVRDLRLLERHYFGEEQHRRYQHASQGGWCANHHWYSR